VAVRIGPATCEVAARRRYRGSTDRQRCALRRTLGGHSNRRGPGAVARDGVLLAGVGLDGADLRLGHRPVARLTLTATLSCRWCSQ
jgi:hypothetical protein